MNIYTGLLPRGDGRCKSYSCLLRVGGKKIEKKIKGKIKKMSNFAEIKIKKKKHLFLQQ